MTPHIKAEKGQIAPTVLLPGDPLRAKFIAEHYLQSPVCYNQVRGVYGYTGTYQGMPISVQATGMGMPSIGIYANELMNYFDVQNLIRVGTTGSLSKQIRVRDIVIAEGASSGQSKFVNSYFDKTIKFAPIADFDLLDAAVHAARKMKLRFHVGNTIGEDRFYNDYSLADLNKLAGFGILAAEEELPALYLLAAKYHRRALGILTVSNNNITGEATTAEERETSFTDMMKLALETAKQFADED